jgi:hypothetical protein
MAEKLLPGPVREFLLTRIDSIAQLEALVLLCSEPSRSWTAAEIARRLYVDESACVAILNSLMRQQLLRSDEGRYEFWCESEALAETVAQVSEHYAKHLIPVTNLIHSKPARIREFANAFRISKEK